MSLLFKKIKERIKKSLFNKKGNEIVAIALVLIFIILAATPYLKTLGKTTSDGIEGLNSRMEEVLNSQVN